jgi:hypothetical protein
LSGGTGSFLGLDPGDSISLDFSFADAFRAAESAAADLKLFFIGPSHLECELARPVLFSSFPIPLEGNLMTQLELNQQIAAVTGESLRTIGRRGFSILQPDDPWIEQDREPLAIDWDDQDAKPVRRIHRRRRAQCR